MSINTIKTTKGKILLWVCAATLASAIDVKAEPTVTHQPKIVVGIVVEDLKSEYVNLLKEHFTAGGFNKLLQDGIVIANVDFGGNLDAAASTAVLYTGASPAVNGIPSAEIFDRATLHSVPIFNDGKTIGNYTNQTMSPSALGVTTIADESRVNGGGLNYAYAFASNPEQAIIMAGHAGNCGLWINDANDSWATTTYYKDVPHLLNGRNRLNPLRHRLDTLSWTPLHTRDKYLLLPEHLTIYPFKYYFRASGPQKIYEFKNSPKVNEEITDFAIENIKALKLGTHPGSDVVSIAYSLSPYAYSRNTDNRYELYDAYFRLDRDLANLFSTIDKSVGLNNALIFLAGTPPSGFSRKDDEQWLLPYGEFSTKKAVSLINLYLIAKYGNGDWVLAYHNGEFFLNHKLIEEKKCDLEEIRLETARFLERMAGVKVAYTYDEIIDGYNPATAALKKNASVKHAGDVRVYVMPGWQIVDDYGKQNGRSDHVVREAATTAPVYILAPNIEATKIKETIDARSIAPTITSIMRIRSPNAASLPPLPIE